MYNTYNCKHYPQSLSCICISQLNNDNVHAYLHSVNHTTNKLTSIQAPDIMCVSYEHSLGW